MPEFVHDRTTWFRTLLFTAEWSTPYTTVYTLLRNFNFNIFLASHQAPQFQSNWRLVFSWPISLWSSYCSNIMERSNFSNFSHITPFRLLHSHLFYITKDSVTNLLIIVQNISHDRDFKGRLRRIIESSEIELQKVFEAAF